MAHVAGIDLNAQLLDTVRCSENFACLEDETVCKVEYFVDRDVELTRCLDSRICIYKTQYGGGFVCTCPVKKAQGRRPKSS